MLSLTLSPGGFSKMSTLSTLKAAREKIGITQIALANAAGIDRARLAGIEGGYCLANCRESTAIRAALVSLARSRIISADDVLNGEIELRNRQPGR
jgi:predicted transcriptional regulator